MDLKKLFRNWYKGHQEIIKLQQGDDNLLAVIFKGFSVATYKYERDFDYPSKKTFKLIEMEYGIKTFKEANKKFMKIVREF